MYFMIFFIVLAIVLLFVCIGYFSRRSNQRKLVAILNEKAIQKFKEQKFEVEKYIYLSDSNTANANVEKKFIALNMTQKKIGLIDYENSQILITDFNDILDFEVYENNVNSLTGGKLGVGLAIYSAQQEVQCKDLRLIIVLKNYESSSIVYDLVWKTFANVGIAKESTVYKEIIRSLQNCISFLKVIKDENSKTENKKD